MMSAARSKAEEKFARMTRQDSPGVDDRASVEQAARDKIAKLRALRLATEATGAKAPKAKRGR
ncbi:MAG: hypothetical protein R3F55_13930 [Alphaproteobacteria bacterium]